MIPVEGNTIRTLLAEFIVIYGVLFYQGKSNGKHKNYQLFTKFLAKPLPQTNFGNFQISRDQLQKTLFVSAL